jgi:leucyl aminopeptidase
MKVQVILINTIPDSITELAKVYEFKGNYNQYLYDQANTTLYVGINYETNPIEINDFDRVLYSTIGKSIATHCPSTTDEYVISSQNINLEQYSLLKLALKQSYYKLDFQNGSRIKPVKITSTYEVNDDALNEGILLSKKLIDQDPFLLNPTTYIEQLRTEFADAPSWVELKIIPKSELIEAGTNMLLGVARGSEHGANIAIVTINPTQEKDTQLFIGKGLTFDTGGVNIKQNGGSFGMQDDMGGSSTVFGVAKTLSMLTQPKSTKYVFASGIVENVTDGKAFQPGEVLENCVGQTSIIKNTDAEGRLTLADVVPFMILRNKPSRVFTLATLTGHAISAYTSTAAPIFSNNVELRNEIYSYFVKNEEQAFNAVLPAKAYTEGLKDSTGRSDMSNTGSFTPAHGIKPAGSQAAAAFVMASSQPKLWKKQKEGLADTIPTIHIDIAGTAVDGKGFGTGYGIKSLVDYCLKNDN